MRLQAWWRKLCFLVSLQSGVHTPHAIGHSLYIMSGFSSHWPSCAHGTHDSCWSVQLKVHTPHESGHREVIESGFFAHSPSRALVRVGRWLWLTGKPPQRWWGRVARMACRKGGVPVAAVGAHVVAYARRSICEVEEEDGESGRAEHHFRRPDRRWRRVACRRLTQGTAIPADEEDMRPEQPTSRYAGHFLSSERTEICWNAL